MMAGPAHSVAALDARGQGWAPRSLLNTRDTFGSAGFGNEVRPEAPGHWTWDGPRSFSALL